jgi:PPOX class probable F420-dependent enzyme
VRGDPPGRASPSVPYGGPARPRARPVPGRALPGERTMSRLAARLPPPGLREIARAPRTTATAGAASVGKHSLLVTFRRDGGGVATPVWAASADGKLYVRSVRGSAKVRRLRRDARVLIAPCTARGRPLGAPFEASGRVLGPEREAAAERALRDAYGLGRALFEWCVDSMRVDMCYLELEPREWARRAN